jgi:hypothetical protein
MNQSNGVWYEVRLDPISGGGFMPFFVLYEPVHEIGARPLVLFGWTWNMGAMIDTFSNNLNIPL